MLYNVTTFTDKHDTTKLFHHVNILGFKFRIATNERSFKKRNTEQNPNNHNLYRTNRGWVWNRNPNKYYCLITNSK